MQNGVCCKNCLWWHGILGSGVQDGNRWRCDFFVCLFSSMASLQRVSAVFICKYKVSKLYSLMLMDVRQATVALQQFSEPHPILLSESCSSGSCFTLIHNQCIRTRTFLNRGQHPKCYKVKSNKQPLRHGYQRELFTSAPIWRYLSGFHLDEKVVIPQILNLQAHELFSASNSSFWKTVNM